MDLRTLNYFVTVAEELNITRAAAKLHMSQPPLSSQMKNLEDELNTQLFIRGKRHLTLTDSGQILYRRAKEILNLAEKTQDEILSMSEGMKATISLGLVEGMAPDIAASWIRGFEQVYPNVNFRIHDGSSDVLIEKLRSGIISLAVITTPCDQSLLNHYGVGTEQVSAMINPEHPLAKEEGNILIQDLIGEPLIVPGRKSFIEQLYKWFKPYGEEPKIFCEMDSYLDAVALSARGVGISIFPRTSFISNDQVVIRDIEGKDKTMEYQFVWLKGHPLPTAEEKFIDHVKEQIGV